MESGNFKIQKIKSQVSIGDEITIYSNSGKEICGNLKEIFEDHLELINANKTITVFETLIAGWEIKEKEIGEICQESDHHGGNLQENDITPILAGESQLQSTEHQIITLETETPKTIIDISSQKPDHQVEVNETKSESPLNEEKKVYPFKSHPSIETNQQEFAEIQESDPSDEGQKFFQYLHTFESTLKKNSLKKIEPNRSLPKYIPIGHKERTKSEWDTILNLYDNYSRSKNSSGLKGLSEKIIILGEDFPKNDVFFFNAGCFLLTAEDASSIEMFEAAISRSRRKEYFQNLAIACTYNNNFRKAQIALENLDIYGSEILRKEILYKLCELSIINNNFKGVNLLFNKLVQSSSENIIDLENDTLGFSEICQVVTYILNQKGKREEAEKFFRFSERKIQKQLFIDTFNEIKKDLPSYDFTEEDEYNNAELSIVKKPNESLIPGQICKYLKARGFGQIKDFDATEYFFHKSAIKDDDLRKRLESFGLDSTDLLVDFRFSEFPRGLTAIEIYEHLTNTEIFKKASMFAENGDYPSAINQIKRLVDQDPRNKSYLDLYTKWQDYAKIEGLPKGADPYARAKRAQIIEKDSETAIELFENAIKIKDNFDTSVKDLALLYDELGRTNDAIDLLNRNRDLVKEKKSIDDLLLTFYKKTNDDKAIVILEKRLKKATEKGGKIKILNEIGGFFIKNYPEKAKDVYIQITHLDPQNIVAQRSLATTYLKIGRYDDSEAIVNTILKKNSNDIALDILIALKKVKESGSVDYNIDSSFFQTLGENEFAEFFLKRCQFQGVLPQRVSKDEHGFYYYKANPRNARDDIQSLEELAKRSMARSPRDRGNYYLSAAKISFDINPGAEHYKKFLVMCFTSMGDATLIENKPLDSAMTWYSESLRIYSSINNESLDKSDSSDAINSFVGFASATLGREKISLGQSSQKNDSVIVDTLEDAFQRYSDGEKLIDIFTSLTLNTSFGLKQILRFIFEKRTYHTIALNYLQKNGIFVENRIYNLQEFSELFVQLRRRKYEKFRNITLDLRTLRQFKFSTAWLDNSIRILLDLRKNSLFSNLDNQRLDELQKLFDFSLNLVKKSSFEEKERTAHLLRDRCESIKTEINYNPTRLSIEEIFPIIDFIQIETNKSINELYRTSAPQISLGLAIDSYYPDNNNRIDLQIAVKNKAGCSPSESMYIIIDPNEKYFSTVFRDEIRLPESLRGGEETPVPITIEVSEDAINSQIFPISIYAKYQTRTGEEKITSNQSFSIKLSPQETFDFIPNPYSAYAEGGPVQDPNMFYGRDDLINNIITTIRTTPHQGKCIVIYGQKRSGKSSILYHINQRLKDDSNILILDLGNIGKILDPSSKTPLLHVLLQWILIQFRTKLNDFYDRGYPDLKITIPSDIEFLIIHPPYPSS
ncbi:tetratricopeptide repeat protein [uncultured Methanoregula sp.]|uniref:tetratricopeptide repeat protein n=1 Tax=uncultured Methanoregula sp. TaxID=1005933 RepID=UPI002AAB33C7|nr:tetratricopeptide repeat protein [uncultured Methanoregula sp.]